MSIMAQTPLLLGLMISGIAAGVFIGSILGPLPFLQTLPSERYVRTHAFLATRYDPFMPICMLTMALCDAAAAIAVPVPGARLLLAAGAVLAASVITVSLMRNAPINRWVQSLNPNALPANWAELDPRPRWRQWHLVRTTLALCALVTNVAAVAFLV
jgi:uncharacterized membrane protein